MNPDSIHINRLAPYSLLFISLFSFGQDLSFGPDLSFIESVKLFVYRQAQIDSVPEFYTAWSDSEKPYYYLYCCDSDRVAQPAYFNADFAYFGNDSLMAVLAEKNLDSLGYHAFCYRSYANSLARLNYRFLSYSNAALTFIILHEFTHYYLRIKKSKIPYEFNEAVSDVIGNYGTLEFAKLNFGLNIDSVQYQIETNENIYKVINETIDRIKANPAKTKKANSRCSRRLASILLKCNSFQKDRFSYNVNNGFLLKNKNYSHYYFLLKEVYLSQGSINKLFHILLTMPDRTKDCESYLKKYCRKDSALNDVLKRFK
jgi:hypothetical protein